VKIAKVPSITPKIEKLKLLSSREINLPVDYSPFLSKEDGPSKSSIGPKRIQKLRDLTNKLSSLKKPDL
jgi:hypothetical protein